MLIIFLNIIWIKWQNSEKYSVILKDRNRSGPYKVPDGINRDAIFCMRDILRELPQIYLARNTSLSSQEFTEIIKSSYARKSDLRLTDLRKKQIGRFQSNYLSLINTIERELDLSRGQQLLEMTMRASVINKYDRVTGDSITYIVQKVQKLRPKLTGRWAIWAFSAICHLSKFEPRSKNSCTWDTWAA